jgi:hypothetical protein
MARLGTCLRALRLEQIARRRIRNLRDRDVPNSRCLGDRGIRAIGFDVPDDGDTSFAAPDT